MSYIGNTANASAFEVLVVKFLNRGFQVGGSFELNESGLVSDILFSDCI